MLRSIPAMVMCVGEKKLHTPRKGITDARGIQLLRTASEVNLSHNEIKDWTTFIVTSAKPSINYYGYQDADGWHNTTWNIGGNPIERLPAGEMTEVGGVRGSCGFGGLLAIDQPGSAFYTYDAYPTLSWVTASADQSFDLTLETGRCKSDDTADVDAAGDVNLAPGDVPLLKVWKDTEKQPVMPALSVPMVSVNNRYSTYSGTGLYSMRTRIVMPIDEIIHYGTADEYHTITFGSQSVK